MRNCGPKSFRVRVVREHDLWPTDSVKDHYFWYFEAARKRYDHERDHGANHRVQSVGLYDLRTTDCLEKCFPLRAAQPVQTNYCGGRAFFEGECNGGYDSSADQ